jgi:hypothetical protein
MRVIRRIPQILGVSLLVAALLSMLWLDWPASTLSRDEAIQTALRAPGNDPLPRSRLSGVKLIHRFDLPALVGQDGATDAKSWDRVWVVVVKGMLIDPTMPGGPPITYTLEVIRDHRPAVVEFYNENGPGDLPASWDQFIDLAG